VTREAHLVELVDADGVTGGATTVDEAHRAPGRLHRAFSVFLRDPAGRVLLQQRAAAKTRFPLRWGNTCCGHPAPGEEVTAAAARRVAEEMGVTGVRLTQIGVYTYYAEDPATGRVEYEYDHVLLGDLPSGARVAADPAEVAGLRWAPVAELRAGLAAAPGTYAPWLAGVTERLERHLRSAVGAAAHPVHGPGRRRGPGQRPQSEVGDVPGQPPGSDPGHVPGRPPGSDLGDFPGRRPGSDPGRVPGQRPEGDLGDRPGRRPESDPGDGPGRPGGR
jgi:isopentenyl-diphosphate Delta-isomerase